MKFLFNFSLLTILAIVAVSLTFISINTVLANQFIQESTQIASTQITSESFSSENSEEKPQPDSLHPEVAEKADILKEKAAEKDITIQLTDGFRTHEEQDALYAQGRTEPGNIVTNARGGESYHNYGLAVDFAVVNDGQIMWDTSYDGNGNGKSDWEEVAEIAKDVGFTWGGDWEDFKDYPHLQMDFDASINDLQNGNHDIY
ncbi:M15 family metallopeptidase [Salinicoccus sp. YB14-2]|uniref:M15 family metallopeptidase n=1 Tax=Salinicoccus sp. YB14-2 TaxID=1572701 RepID=UPI0009E2D31C|nr:M15 family metallopeptidase [Salinicoccus sp. YB14-2]